MRRRIPVALAKIAASVCLVASTGCTTVSGWLAPRERLTFPAAPVSVDADARWYDVNRDGFPDFALLRGDDGRFDVLGYDDDQDGNVDRRYRMSDYDARHVPHLILLVDSLPYRIVADRFARGDWPYFYPPQKVIAPFPSLSEVTFGAMLHAPPLGGNIERYYDRRTNEIRNLWIARAFGYQHAWQKRLDAHLESYIDVGMSYLNPRPWYAAELARSKASVDHADHRVVICYVVSSSAMLSRYGETGLHECLDQLDRICLQLLYERQGAVKITVVSDHGHNLTPSRNFLMAGTLARAGFRPVDTIRDRLRDVVIEVDGLVTWFGVHTSRPSDVADALVPCPEIELASYLSGESVIVRDALGTAAIERQGSRFRYRAVAGDPLQYTPLLERLREEGRVDVDGFMDDADWFAETADLEFPDGPRRLWDAFHGQVVNPPEAMFTLRDGVCAGLESMESWIRMQSTHGGLNQRNSDAVVMTTVSVLDGPMRTKDVIPKLEPGLGAALDL